MEMGIEQLIPGMQNGNKAQFAAEPVFGIFGKGEQCLRYGFKQDIEHNRFVG